MNQHLRRRDLLAFAATLPVVSAAGALAQKHGDVPKRHDAETSSPVLPRANVTLNVRDFLPGGSATGDGKTKDTVALQLALDRCSVLGGGEVVMPAGDYLTGTLRMHSRTTLRIEQGPRCQKRHKHAPGDVQQQHDREVSVSRRVPL